MYSQRITTYPAAGKAPELRTLLEERVRQRQSQGIAASLAVAAFGAEGPALHMTLRFDDLAALDAHRASPQGQQDPAFASRMAALTRQPARLELYEILLAAPASTSPVRYIQRVTTTPLAGKGRDVQALVIERAKSRQTAGGRVGVSVQAAGPAAGSIVTTVLFGNLGELEKQRAINQTDASFQQYAAKISALAAGPAQIEIFEVLVPYQPRQ
jgi:quinol monooxygenase YgiN